MIEWLNNIRIVNGTMATFLILLSLGLLGFYFYWRFFWFFRDPERKIPDGNNVVSPADGTVIYVRQIVGTTSLFVLKKGKKIFLDDILRINPNFPPYYLIGIFMHPTSVHVNRAPISGKVEKIKYFPGKNLPLTLTWWRILLKLKPFEKYSTHLLHNERNVIKISGQKIACYVIQIADIYVKKIECWVKEGEEILKGQRIGMIKFGSQVDMVLSQQKGIQVLLQAGDKVKAGETIIAKY